MGFLNGGVMMQMGEFCGESTEKMKGWGVGGNGVLFSLSTFSLLVIKYKNEFVLPNFESLFGWR